MALPNEAQKRKHLTAEEHAMRRAEMARRRKSQREAQRGRKGASTHQPPPEEAASKARSKDRPRGRRVQQRRGPGAREAKPALYKLHPERKRDQPGRSGGVAASAYWPTLRGDVAKPAPRPYGGRLLAQPNLALLICYCPHFFLMGSIWIL